MKFRHFFAFAAFLMVTAFASFADTLPAMPTGFYQALPSGKIVYVFQEMIHNDDGDIELGLSIVNQDGYLLKTELQKDGGLKFTSKKGATEIHPLDLSHFQIGKTLMLLYLGEDQLSAANKLKIEADFPLTRYLSHRGTAEIPVTRSHSFFPGNTIPAMNLSLLNGYDGFEFDVQLTADQQFVVSHDDQLSVSTNCTGRVSESRLDDVMNCDVKFTGFIPEKRWFHSRAKIYARIPSLAQVLQQFIPDSRVKRLVIDVKPGDLNQQAHAFIQILKTISAEDQNKLIFLIRDVALQKKLEAEGFTHPLYAIESSSGWDPLEHPDQYFKDRPVEGISLSLGVGLGFAGMHMNNLFVKVQGIWSAVSAVFNGLTHSDKIDVGMVRWSKKNQARFLEVLARAEKNHVQIVGWTINTPLKIQWLRDHAPKLEYVISDLPFRAIAKLQIEELQSKLK